MVTVTFPIRTASAPQLAEGLPGPVGPGGAAFEAVFARGQPRLAPPDRAAPDRDEPVQSELVRGDTVRGDTAKDDLGPGDTVQDDTGTVAKSAPDDTGIEGEDGTETPAAADIFVPMPVPVLVAAQLLEPVGAAVAPNPPPGLVQPLLQAATSGAVTAILAAPEAASASELPASGPAATATQGPPSVPSVPPAVAGPTDEGTADSPSGKSDGGAVETGLFVLAGEPGAATRRSVLPSGMPAFWAAMDAAATEGSVETDVALPGQSDSTAEAAVQPDADLRAAGARALSGKGIDAAVQPGAAVPALPVPLQAPSPAPLLARAPEPAEAAPDAASGPASAVTPQPAQPLQSALPHLFVPQGLAPQMALSRALFPHAPVPVLPPRLPAEIAAEIAARPERPLELRLAPAELGGLTLNLRQDGDILRVVLQADRPDTLDLLRRNGDILRQELQLEGFAGASISFGDGGGARDRHAPSGLQASFSDAESPGLAAPGAARSSRPATASQGLDLRL